MKKLNTQFFIFCTTISILLIPSYIPAQTIHNQEVTQSIQHLIDNSSSQNKKKSDTSGFNKDLQDAIQLSTEKKEMKLLATIYNIAGINYRNCSRYKEALMFHFKALQIGQEANDYQQMAYSCNMLGQIYLRTDENGLALDLFFQALKDAQTVGDSLDITLAYSGIGEIYLNQMRISTSIEYFNKALHISRLIPNHIATATNLNLIGKAYFQKQSLDSALSYFHQSLELSRKLRFVQGESHSLTNLSDVYLSKNQVDLALLSASKALNINQYLNDGFYISNSYLQIGKIYLQRKEYNHAIQFLKKSLTEAEKIDSKRNKEEVCRLLSKLYEAIKNYPLALEYQKHARILNDSLLNESNQRHLDVVETVYTMAQKETEAELLKNELLLNEERYIQQRNIVISIAIILLVIVITILLLFNHKRLKSKYEQSKLEQRLMRSQMNPHFIFNALSAIQVFILENNKEKSFRYLSDFARLMRMVLRSTASDLITLKDEIDTLNFYVELQQLRFVDPFDIQYTIQPDIDSKKTMVQPLFLQPLIENAIDHGLKPLKEKGLIEIRISRIKNMLHIEVDDNGIGIDKAKCSEGKSKEHQSLAIKITKGRVINLSNEYNMKGIFEIRDKSKIDKNQRGTIVTIEIPLLILHNGKPCFIDHIV